jgi:aspartate aminotransferase
MPDTTAPARTAPNLSERLQTMAPSPTIAASARARALARDGKPVLELTVGEPDFDTPVHICEAAHKAIRDGKTRYTPSGGIPELKGAVARKLHRENGVEYDPATEVCICNGGKQALYNVMVALLNPGDEVIVPVPTWPTFADQVALVGGVPVLVPMGPDNRLRVANLTGRVTPRTKAVIVNSPSNPTGAVMHPEDVLAVTRFAMAHGIFVVADDTYEHFLYDGATHQFAANGVDGARDWVLAVNTVSKTYAMTGWRIGYVAGPSRIVRAIDALMTQTTSNPSSIAQWAAVEALDGPQDCVHEMVTEFDARRQMFVAGLRAVGYNCPMPEGAFYAYPSIPRRADGSPGDSNAYAMRLLNDAHISCVGGKAFFDEGTLRMSYAASRAVLQEVLDRLSRYGH